MSAPESDLSVPGRRSTRSRWVVGGWVVAAMAVVAVGAWYATHPTPLPSPQGEASGTTTSDTPLYVGQLRTAGRTLHLRSARLHTTGGEATLLVCRDGSLGVTTDAAAFCSALEELPARLEPGDQLVTKVSGEAGSTVVVDPPTVIFREGLQWGEDRTGRPVEVTVLGAT